LLRLHDPVFLIPAAVLHRLARRAKTKRGIRFTLDLNLIPNSHDQWSPYRVALSDVGTRLLEIIDGAVLKPTGRVPQLSHDGVWLSRTLPGGRMSPRASRRDRTYSLIRNAVLERNNLRAWYKGHLRLFSPFILGTKAGDPHV